ncbi:MAG: response regulator [Labilithrix sp.]|nr:response regulator [Labilithrix sp.]MCW5817972.1 response regulator [Labilithrix sp.]
MSWILLVDDHDDGREVLAEFLSFNGFEVEGCGSGEDALARIEERGAPGVVLTDLTLGAMSGIDLAKKIRGAAATAKVPLVAVTGHVSFADPDGLFAEILPKPVPLPRLVDTVKRALGA